MSIQDRYMLSFCMIWIFSIFLSLCLFQPPSLHNITIYFTFTALWAIRTNLFRKASINGEKVHKTIVFVLEIKNSQKLPNNQILFFTLSLLLLSLSLSPHFFASITFNICNTIIACRGLQRMSLYSSIFL